MCVPFPARSLMLAWPMNASFRKTALSIIVLASLCGCRALGQFAFNSPTTMFRMASSMFHHDAKDEPSPGAVDTLAASSGADALLTKPPAANTGTGAPRHTSPAAKPAAAAAAAEQVAPASRQTSVEGYKTEVAQHVVESNRDQTFSGKLPEMLPAIVVLRITVDRNGNITDVEVQRYRDPEAAWVAVTSMRLADPLPRPVKLLATDTAELTFLETFLFDANYHFQLRSLVAAQ
jgi:protein TonB